MEEIATKASWKNEPIDNPRRIEISLHFTEKQFSNIIRGLLPQQMEDKWFIYFENGWLYIHRSWTGLGIYKAQIIKEEDGFSINEFWVERKLENYSNTDDNEDIEIFTFLIARGLLRIDVRNLFAARNINTEADTIKGWSNFGNLLFSNQGIDYTFQIKSVLFGVVVGDVLGVPHEFKSRQILNQNPAKDMIGYGTHNQPAGTFSDDSSLTFCLAEALTEGFDLKTIGQKFVKWYSEGYWAAHGEVFDIGNATRFAIDRLSKGVKPELAGGFEGKDNGNGSLMRISPLLFYIKDKPIEERFEITKHVSSLTHGHIRSVIACFYYLEFARLLLEQKDEFDAYSELQAVITSHLTSLSIPISQIAVFDRLLRGNIYELPEEAIASSGYVLHTLEASIWCLLTTDNYKDSVLKAVNLGDDTDTTAAVTGGLAGLLYGLDDIPREWLDKLARREDIDDLAERLNESLINH